MLDTADPPLHSSPCIPGTLTGQPHVDERVINQHQLVEVELVGEPLALGLVQNAFVIVIAVGTKHHGAIRRTLQRTQAP